MYSIKMKVLSRNIFQEKTQPTCYNSITCYNGYNKNIRRQSMEKYRRKITKIGNSYGVTFPKELLKEAKISYGDNVSVELKDGKIVLQREEEIKLPDGVDSEFMETLTDVIKEHETAFKGLVDR